MAESPGSPGNGKWAGTVWASALGLHLALSVGAGAALGYLLDRWLATSPWLLTAGFLLGVAAGFREVFRQVREHGAEE